MLAALLILPEENKFGLVLVSVGKRGCISIFLPPGPIAVNSDFSFF